LAALESITRSRNHQCRQHAERSDRFSDDRLDVGFQEPPDYCWALILDDTNDRAISFDLQRIHILDPVLSEEAKYDIGLAGPSARDGPFPLDLTPDPLQVTYKLIAICVGGVNHTNAQKT
jgi:hypothetical protein